MNRSAKLKISLSVAAVLLSPLASMQSQANPATLNVRAIVASACLIDNVTQMNFAITPGTAANYDAQSTITWRCTNGTPGDITLNGGTTTGDINDRRMTIGGGNDLPYQLYTDAARTDLWGDGATGSDVAIVGAGMGAPSAQSTQIYGRVLDADAAAAVPNPGYQDDVTVTIVF